MYFYGSFLTQLAEKVTVHIVTQNRRDVRIEIGSDNSGLYFTTDPVNIESSVNDTFDHLLRSQATIRLLARDFVPDFFCASCKDAVVNIFKGDECIFAGFIQPQTYSQAYNELYDELEISCIDVLSALQDSRYRNVGGLGINYESVKANAGQVSFKEVMDAILGDILSSIDLLSTGGVKVWYDGSKGLTSSSDRYALFEQLAISELLFLGSEEDDVWQSDKVLETMLKYLNLHIVQQGLEFYIYSWESIKGTLPLSWKEMTTGETRTHQRTTTGIGLDNVASNDTSISIGEVYNQILLTCRIESIDTIVKSPLDDSDLISPYTNKQKYMTEYSSDGEGETAYWAFYDMTHDKETNYDGGMITDWWIQVMTTPLWTFPYRAGNRQETLVELYCRNNANQQALPNYLSSTPGAAIISFGKVERKTDKKDNSLISKIDMSNYFVVSVNGNGKDDQATAYPSEASLRDNAPLAVYDGNTTGGIYSPSDEATTNYIVLSGKIVLNPVMAFTDAYKTLRDNATWEYLGYSPWHKTVPSRTNGDGRYYTQQYWICAQPNMIPVWDTNRDRGLVPFTGTGPQEYEFLYSAIGDATDTVSKVAVLACMLIIGDKCVIETGTQGQISDFQWKKYKTREECASDDEYYQQCFYIGFDPKIGDKLIGTEFDFQNNISFMTGIEAEGIAIPIRKSDKLSGPVKFMVLGPVNTSWGDVTRRHRTWFRKEKWGENAIPLLSHVSSIFMKEFEVKIYSDNGLINNSEDNDIVYLSDTRENFINRKDDITFEISSSLTLAECRQLGVSASFNLSSPLDLSTGYGILSVYDHCKGLQAKPEQLYVDSYYSEYHKPRIIMTQKLNDRGRMISVFGHYSHPAMSDKAFFVQGISRNLIEGYAELTLKEIDND